MKCLQLQRLCSNPNWIRKQCLPKQVCWSKLFYFVVKMCFYKTKIVGKDGGAGGGEILPTSLLVKLVLLPCEKVFLQTQMVGTVGGQCCLQVCWSKWFYCVAKTWFTSQSCRQGRGTGGRWNSCLHTMKFLHYPDNYHQQPANATSNYLQQPAVTTSNYP